MTQLDVDLVHDLKESVTDGSLVLQLQPEKLEAFPGGNDHGVCETSQRTEQTTAYWRAGVHNRTTLSDCCGG